MQFESAVIVTLIVTGLVVALLIGSANTRHQELIYKFEIKCEKRGGVMVIPKVSKGRGYPECRNPNSIIDMG